MWFLIYAFDNNCLYWMENNYFLKVDLQARAHCDMLTNQVTAGPSVPTQF
jgi:hypothetical protein